MLNDKNRRARGARREFLRRNFSAVSAVWAVIDRVWSKLLERTQKRNQILFLTWGQTQVEPRLVELDDVLEGRG